MLKNRKNAANRVLQSTLAFITGITLVGSACALVAAPTTDNSGKAYAAPSGNWKHTGGWWYSYNNGGFAKGWQKIDGSWYYFDTGGWMKTGWQKINGAWYYLNPSGTMATGWKQVGSSWYYLNSSGVMQTGWQKIGGTWYYLNNSGAMLVGWQHIGDSWYYFASSGAMVSNSWAGDYYLSSSGAMVTNSWIGNYYVGSDGKWIPNYKPTDSTVTNPQDPTQGSGSTTPGTVTESIGETVLYNEAGIKITALSLDKSGYSGPELQLLIENNTDKELTFQCRDASVNGYMVDTIMSADVVPGKKVNHDLTFMESDLKEAGITSIADMEFSFHIFESETWDTYLDTAPIQLKTSIANTYPYTYDDSGKPLYNDAGVRIVFKGISEDYSYSGPSAMVYIENNTGRNITVQTRNESVNGFMVDPIFSCDVAAGKRVVDGIVFPEWNLEKNGISVLNDVELSFHIFEEYGWDTIVDTDIIKID